MSDFMIGLDIGIVIGAVAGWAGVYIRNQLFH